MSLITHPELELAKGIDWRTPITIDFETYYDKEWSLTKITTEKYIRGDKFECIGLSIKIGNMPTYFHRKENWKGFVNSILEKYPNSPFVCHNASFDMGILGLRYGIHPRFTVDTAVMAKLCGLDRVAGGTSLAKITDFLCDKGVLDKVKGTEVHNMLGVHADDMTEAQWKAYGEYCKLDTDLCYQLYMYMIDKVPLSELVMSYITTEMWTKPVVDIDVPLLEQYAEQLSAEREQMLKGIAGKLGLSTDDMLKNLRSAPKFKAILESLGVKVPMKHSEKQNKLVPALSKTDQEFLALQEHPNKLVSTLVSTKLGAMSSMEQTRTATFLDIAERGLMPIPLRYSAAHTGRYGGSDKVNLQNLSKRTKDPILRRSLRAVDGNAWVASDSSQIEARLLAYISNQSDVVDVFKSGKDVYLDMASKIYGETYESLYEQSKGANATKEGKLKRTIGKVVVLGCIGKGTEVLTNRGWIAIQDVQDTDLLWDGEHWVSHGGVVCKGVKDCYNVNSIYLTSDHKIFDGTNWKSFDDLDDGDGTQEFGYWWFADAENWAIANLPTEVVEDWECDGTTGKLWCEPDTDGKAFDASWKSACLFEPSMTYDILDVGEHNRFFVRSAYYDIAKPTYLCVHNCGYGAGAVKFADLMVQSGLAEQADQAERLIATYRSANYMVKNFWGVCQQALDTMAMGGTMHFGGADSRLFVASGSTKFHGVTIPSIKLPNGTYIFYQNLRQEVDDKGKLNYVYDQWKGRGFEPKRIWGSALAENLCQSLAFAILKWQAMCIQADGFQINLNIHDEWAGVYHKERLKQAVLSYHRHMSRVPPFLPQADGLLECEVDVGINYADFTTIPNSAFKE